MPGLVAVQSNATSSTASKSSAAAAAAASTTGPGPAAKPSASGAGAFDAALNQAQRPAAKAAPTTAATKDTATKKPPAPGRGFKRASTARADLNATKPRDGKPPLPDDPQAAPDDGGQQPSGDRGHKDANRPARPSPNSGAIAEEQARSATAAAPVQPPPADPVDETDPGDQTTANLEPVNRLANPVEGKAAAQSRAAGRPGSRVGRPSDGAVDANNAPTSNGADEALAAAAIDDDASPEATAGAEQVASASTKPVEAPAINAPGGDASTAAAAASAPAHHDGSTTNAAQRAAAAASAPASAELQFAEDNHPKIATAVHGKLLPNGGSMQMRLDPPELGSIHIKVEMRDGVMIASLEAHNEQATRLLSHTLGDLRAALEAQGVSVDKLHVRQASQDQPAGDHGSAGREAADPQQEQAARQEQQRKEMLRRMWRRLTNGQDPLDLVA